MGSPHSTHSSKSDDTSRINQPGPNQPAPQPAFPQPPLDSAVYTPKPGATGPVATTTEEFPPPRLIPERTLYPIPETSVSASEGEYNNNNALGFSSGLENRSATSGGDVAPDEGNHVRFRLPSMMRT